jgi:hypothetical protein
MNAKKHPPIDPPDPSLHPTRKVESMSSIAAELLLQEHEGRFDEQTGRRLRSSHPPAFDPSSVPPSPVSAEVLRPVYPDASQWASPPWRPSISPTMFASHSPTPAKRPATLRIALLAGGALLLVVLSVTITLLVTR